MVPTIAPNISLIPPVVQNSSLYDGMQQSNVDPPPDAYAFRSDLVYIHMDLNYKVRLVFSVTCPPLIQRIDPLYGHVPSMAQILSQVP